VHLDLAHASMTQLAPKGRSHLVLAADTAEIGLHVDDDPCRRILRAEIAIIGPGLGLGLDSAFGHAGVTMFACAAAVSRDELGRLAAPLALASILRRRR
jgi:hypothetical protein